MEARSTFAVVMIVQSLFWPTILMKSVTEADFDKVVDAVYKAEERVLENRIENLKAKESQLVDTPSKRDDSSEMESEISVIEEAIKRLTNGIAEDDLGNDDVRSESIRDQSSCPQSTITCDPNAKYRTYDGSCTNLDNPEWGKAQTPFERLIPPEYGPGYTLRGSDNNDMPSARGLSNEIFKAPKDDMPNADFSVLLMSWGQFIDHDIAATKSNNVSGECCDTNNKDNPSCANIDVPADDKVFQDCLSFVRSLQETDCATGKPEQINTITQAFDGSNVYGSSESEMKALLDEEKPYLLKRTKKGNLLPISTGHGECETDTPDDICYMAGDARVNENPALVTVHLFFMRLHNDIAKQLLYLNPKWSHEQVFEETRKIVIAIMLQITHTEWLPKIIGEDAISKYGLQPSKLHSDTYDKTINPNIFNSFATAAYRFGHSLIMPKLFYLDEYYKKEGNGFKFEDVQLRTFMVSNGEEVSKTARSMTFEPCQEADSHFVEAVRSHLFNNGDLAARNIQRGRDHGIPGYSKYRALCGLSVPTKFDTGKNGFEDIKNKKVKILKDLYQNVEDVDLFVGGMMENNVNNGQVGPLFACIIGKQFENLKKGDRFWYENKDDTTGFTEDQLKSIKEVKLAHLICRHFGLAKIQPDPFVLVDDKCEDENKCKDDRNCLIPCHAFNASPWAE